MPEGRPSCGDLKLVAGPEQPFSHSVSWWSQRSRCKLVASACLLGGTCSAVMVCFHFLESARKVPESTVGIMHRWPEMYGKVPEKTIWSYWYHPDDCPSSRQCVMPPVARLCTESVWQNRGSFEHRVLHRDDIERFVSRTELPLHFDTMRAAVQKDALMNVLLARYGGVALDITTILLRPLDEYWDDMVSKGATFWGYMYRLTGMPWGNSEVAAVWFLMSRREGIFSTAVRSQLLGMGDSPEPLGRSQAEHFYHNPYFALGDQTLTPILSMFNYSWPKCTEDETVGPPVSWPDMCPEYEFPRWNSTMPGPPRNDAIVLLREPRDGPQLPFAFLDEFSMGAWHVNSTEEVDAHIAPMCRTMQECWDGVFIRRFHERSGQGEPHLLNFVKLFNRGGAALLNKSRAELLADTESYFYNWLKLAGLQL